MKKIILLAIMASAVQAFAQDLKINSANFPSDKQFQKFTGAVWIYSEKAISNSIETRVYLSTDGVLDANDVHAATYRFSSLGAGQTLKLDAPVDRFATYGILADPGDYFLIIVTDYYNFIAETNENNNTLVAPFTVMAATFDLGFVDISVDNEANEIVPGGNLPVQYTIRNYQDNLRTIKTTFYLAPESDLDQRLLEWEIHTEMNWNSVASFTEDLEIPLDFESGSYFLMAEINETAVYTYPIIDEDPSDNVAYVGWVGVNPLDVDLTATNFEALAENEREFGYRIDITNNGSVDIDAYGGFKFIFSADATLDAGDTYTIEVPNSTRGLFAWQTKRLEGVLDLYGPKTYIPAGTWNVFAVVNYTHEIAETSYTNNQAMSVGKVVIAPYTIGFDQPPSVSKIYSTGVILNTGYPELGLLHYKLQLKNTLPPDASTLVVSDTLFYGWIEDLTPNTSYDLYMMGQFNDGTLTPIVKLSFTTLANDGPSISVSEYVINFGNVSLDSLGSRVYEISGADLNGPINLATEGRFVISRDGEHYSNTLAFSAAEFANNTSRQVWVRVNPADTVGNYSGSIVHTSTGFDGRVVWLYADLFDPAETTFDRISSLSEAGWESLNLGGAQTWSLENEAHAAGRVSAENSVVRIDGGAGGIRANEDWLISPSLNLSTYNMAVLSFYSKSIGEGLPLELKYSFNYKGDPSAATWIELNGEFPEVNSDVWKLSSNIGLPSADKIHVAFVYRSTTTAATTWSIDDWKVIDALPTAIEKESHVAFSTYPNPTSGNVSVEWRVPVSASVAVKVVSAQGVVLTTFHSATNDLGTYLSAVLENAPAGVYQIHLADGARSYVTRVVRK